MAIDQINPIVLGAAIGAGVSGIFVLINQWFIHRSEDRRRRRELAINTAIAYWQRDTDMAKFKSEKGLGGTAIAPLDLYIIHMLKLSDLIDHKCLTIEDITIELAKIKKSIRAAFADIEKEQNKDKET